MLELNHVEATKRVLRATRPEDRLRVLKKATMQYDDPEDLGAFCAAVGATSDELGYLFLDRAAHRGLRPEVEEIIVTELPEFLSGPDEK